jgi:anti-sigma-K factor RskA
MATDLSSGGELHLLTGAYALDALDPAEREAFEEHLTTCESCQAEVKELRATAGVLGAAAAETPPPSLKERVMAEVDRTRQDSPLSVEQPVVDVAEQAEPSVVVPMRQRRTTRVFQLAAAVMTVLALGLGIWGVQNHNRASDANRNYASVQTVLAAPDADVKRGNLSGSGVSGTATVVSSKSVGKSVFVSANLSAPPSGKTYQLWYMDSAGKARPAGLVQPGGHNTAAQVLKGTIGDATVVGVTVEPAGGSAQPTTDPVLAVSIA